MTNKLYVTISTGWAIRNYLYTGVLSALANAEQHVVILCTPELHDEILRSISSNYIEVRNFSVGEEPFCWRVLRRFRKKLYMESRNSQTEKIWETYGDRSMAKSISGMAIKILGKVFGNYNLNRLAELIDYRVNKNSRALLLFNDANDDAVFLATHASTYFEESIFRAARDKCKCSILAILSWDHLSSKITIGPLYNHLFVWNEISRDEILETMNCYVTEQIHIVGAPQFDIYKHKPEISYEQWCQGYGLSPQKKTILFSTIPQVRHDGQRQILDALANKFSSSTETFGDLQILVKIHPLDQASIYETLTEYPFIRLSSTSAGAEMVADNYSLSVNRNALYFCTLNVNIFSTMTLESAYLDKPVVHIAFDLPGQNNPVPCEKYYEFDHFAPITQSGCSDMAKSIDELVSHLDRICHGGDSRQAERATVANLYFGNLVGHSSKVVVEELAAITNRQNC